MSLIICGLLRTDLKAAMNTIQHDGDEFMIRQTAVVVGIEYLKDCVHNMLVQFHACRDANRARELRCKFSSFHALCTSSNLE